MSPHAIWDAYFGYPLGAVYSNLLASGICSVLVYLRMRAKLRKSQAALASQAERQHAELQAQATAHQNELKHQAEKHNQRLLDQAEEHHQALKQHVTATLRLPASRRGAPS